MSDIVERLDTLAREYHQHRPHYEAAKAEIERLQAERDLWKERTEQGSLIIEGNVAEIERLNSEVKALQKMIGAIDRQHAVEIERLKDEAAVNETVIHGLRANRDDAETEIDRLNKEVAAWKQFGDLKKAENAQLRRDGNTIIDKVMADNKQLQAEIERLQAERDLWKESNVTEIERLQERLADTQAVIAQQITVIKQLRALRVEWP